MAANVFAPTPGPVNWVAPVGFKAQPGRWIGEGWEIVKADMGNFALMALIFLALNGIVPLILQGPLIIGFHIFCIKKILRRGGATGDMGDLFKGFNFFLPALLATIVIGVFAFAGTLLCIIPGLVITAMYKFTYLFIVDKKMDFWPAMQASHAVAKNDYFGFTMFLLLMFLVNLLGALCCVVGILVSVPVTMAAITVAYREIVGFEQASIDTL